LFGSPFAFANQMHMPL